MERRRVARPDPHRRVPPRQTAGVARHRRQPVAAVEQRAQPSAVAQERFDQHSPERFPIHGAQVRRRRGGRGRTRRRRVTGGGALPPVVRRGGAARREGDRRPRVRGETARRPAAPPGLARPLQRPPHHAQIGIHHLQRPEDALPEHGTLDVEEDAVPGEAEPAHLHRSGERHQTRRPGRHLLLDAARARRDRPRQRTLQNPYLRGQRIVGRRARALRRRGRRAGRGQGDDDERCDSHAPVPVRHAVTSGRRARSRSCSPRPKANRRPGAARRHLRATRTT